MAKGWKISGQERFARTPDKLNYHMADRGGRMYWCDCARCLRIGNQVKMAWSLKGQDANKLAMKRGGSLHPKRLTIVAMPITIQF